MFVINRRQHGKNINLFLLISQLLCQLVSNAKIKAHSTLKLLFCKRQETHMTSLCFSLVIRGSIVNRY